MRAQIWTLIQAARLDHDLGLDARPHDAEFDDFILHVDGWLCEVKDAQIRDGLHVLGVAPEGRPGSGLVLAMLQAGRSGRARPARCRGCARRSGWPRTGGSRAEVDRAEGWPARLAEGMEQAGWAADAVAEVTREVLTEAAAADAAAGTESDLPARPGRTPWPRVLRFAADRADPPAGRHHRRARRRAARAGRRARACRAQRLAAARPGQRAAHRPQLLRGRPKAVPSRLAWETGQQLAESLLARYREDTGQWPTSVGLSVWGTAAMRTSGDDIAEVLALLGRPAAVG